MFLLRGGGAACFALLTLGGVIMSWLFIAATLLLNTTDWI